MFKNLFLKLSLVVLSLIFSLLIAEIYFWNFKPQKTIDNLSLSYIFECYQPGTYYWVSLKPNKQCMFMSAEGDFPVKTNNIGTRGTKVTIPKPADTLRVLFIGDSFTFGLNVNDGEPYPEVVQKLLQEKYPHKKVDIVNAGIPATGPGYYYLFLKNEIQRIQPDIVVIGYFMQNDIPDHQSIIWEKVDSQGLPEKLDSRTVYINHQGLMLPKIISLKYRVPVLNHSHLFAFLMDSWKDEGVTIFEMPLSPITPEACLYKKDCHDVDEAKAKVKKLFLGMKDLAATNNAKFLVTFIPAQFQITHKSNARIISNIPIPLLPSDKEYPFEQFSSFFEDHGIDYLDPREKFREVSNTKDLYFKTDPHFNIDGHITMAEIISDRIYQQYLKEP